MSEYRPKSAKPLPSEPYRPKSARPLETVQPAPGQDDEGPGALATATRLLPVLPAASVLRLATGAYDALTDSKRGPTTEAMDAAAEAMVPGKRLSRALALNYAQGATKGWADEGAQGLFSLGSAAPIRVQGQEQETPAFLRDSMRAELRDLQGEYPIASLGAYVAGDLSSDYLAKRAGIPVETPAYQVASGALSGAGLSEGDTAGRVALDAAVGGGSALAGSALGRYVIGPVLSRGGNVLRGALNRFAIQQGRRVLLNGADSLSSRVPTSDAAVREALDSDAIRPLGTTKGAYERLENFAEQLGDTYAATVEKLRSMGVKGADAERLAAEMQAKAKALRPHTMGPELPAEFEKQAEELLTKRAATEIPAVERKIPGNAYRPERTVVVSPAKTVYEPELDLVQAENLKRSLQTKARYGKIEDTPVNEVKKEIASMMRQANEDAIEKAGAAAPLDSELQRTAESFVPIKRKLGRTLEARNAAQRGAARGDQRRLFSLTDNMFVQAGLAAGDPTGAVAQGLANNLVRNVGTSTAAWSARKAAESGALKALRASRYSIGRAAAPAVNAMTADREALIEWLRAKREDESASP